MADLAKINGVASASIAKVNGVAVADIAEFGGVAWPAGGTFDPSTDIAGCQLWLDANQIEGLNDTDPVATWSDLSGQDYHLTQSTAGFKPTYQTNEINTLPIVRFDGADDYLEKTSFFNPGAGDFTVSVVAEKQGNGGFADGVGNLIYYVGTVTGNNAIWIAVDNSGNIVCKVGWNGAAWTTELTGTTTMSNGVPHIITLKRGSNVLYLYVDGSQEDTDACNLDLTTYGSTMRLGTNFDRDFNGDIAEVVAYNSALSDGDRGDVEAYLSGKYNIALP